MKKMLKIAGAVILMILAVLVILFFILSRKPAAPNDFQKTVQTGGKIETRYMVSGPCEVSTYEQSVLQNFKKYEIFYPEELKTSGRTYPVIVICNGSGTPLSKYPAVPKQLASWGFIVIGTEEEYAWNGFGAEMCIRYLERLNETEQTEKDEPNFFFQKIDLSKTGILGHSQGGVRIRF